MVRRHSVVIAFAGLIVLLSGMVLDELAAQGPANDKNVKALAASGNDFACDLYAKVSAEQGNLFISPASISTALGMVYAGARGETASEMKKTLHFTLEDKALHPAMKGLSKKLSAKRKGLTLTIANALWGQKDYGFVKEYLDLSRKNYGAELNEVDFKDASEEARKKINSWVRRKTGSKIKELMAPGSPDPATRLVLTNAIYFKGTWQYEFKKKNTKKETFHLSKDKSAKVKMMHMKEIDLKHTYGDDFMALELPYKGGKVAMVIFLPDKVDGLAKFEAKLTKKNLDKWLAKMSKGELGEVAIPRFKMSRGLELGDMLMELGMPSAFVAGRADFSGMTGTKDLFLSRVVHKAFVEVNEKGTEAAAATAAEMTLGEPSSFIADHPFFFLIRDNDTGAILFMGRVVDPTQQ